MNGSSTERLFRKVALERLSSPDRLDALVGINRPRTALVLAGIAVAIATILAWGTYGRIVQKIAARCILTSPGGVAEVTAIAAGRVTNLTLKVGDRVRAGEQIAKIVREDLYVQIAQARARLAERERRSTEVNQFGHLAGVQGNAGRASEQRELDAQARLAADRAQALERRLAIERELLVQGLITKQAVLDTDQALAGAVLERERLRDRAKQMSLQGAEEERQRNREAVSIMFQVNETRRNLDALLDIERQTAPVISPYAGRVIEVKVNDGVTVAYGSSLIQVERVEGDGAAVEAALYISGGEGKLLASGMPVEIVPDYVKRQEFGFLRGRVEQVSEYPASLPGMRLLVQNDNLLRELSKARSAIFARASLERRADGSFEWSAAAANPPAVRSGALCQAEVTVGERRPADLILPAIRLWLGVM